MHATEPGSADTLHAVAAATTGPAKDLHISSMYMFLTLESYEYYFLVQNVILRLVIKPYPVQEAAKTMR